MPLSACLALAATLGLPAASARPKAQPKKLAVLGTGVGNMAAVFYLTNYTGWEEDWDIDVYQYGWRMGGRAASGRTMSDAKGSRVLEHGLHILFGWYNNAFMWVQDLYRAWQPPADSPIKTFQDAFQPSCGGGCYLHRANKDPEYRPIADAGVSCGENWAAKNFSEAPGYPRPAPTPWALFVELVYRLRDLFPEEHGAYAAPIQAVFAAVQPAGEGPGSVGSPRRAALLSRLRAFQSAVAADLAALAEGKLSEEELAAKIGRTGYEHAGYGDPRVGYKPTPADLALLATRVASVTGAMGVGIIADDVTGKGFNQLNDETLLEWLARHGSNLPLDRNDAMRTFQDTVFGYVGGMLSKPNFAAGTAIRGTMYNMGTMYPPPTEPIPGSNKGPLMRFQAGMGEIFMSPSYQVLKQRGVKFHFFHKVTDLRSTDGTTVDAIDIDVQATVKAGSAEYEPLFPVKSFPVWPDLSTPKECDGCDRFFDQLEEADALKAGNVNLESWYSGWSGKTKTLKLGQDFDMVLNGITNGALRHVSKDLAAKNEAWRNWTSTTKVVATQTLQMWVYNTTYELGYGKQVPAGGNPSGGEATIGGGPEPFDTWADFSHLVRVETENATGNGGVAAGCHHFLSPIEFDGDGDVDFSDTSVPSTQFARAYAGAVKFVENDIKNILPNWDYSSMVAPVGVTGQDRLKHQYWRTNYEPGDLYVLSVAGSMKYRPTPFKYREVQDGAQPFSNMALAGDHVNNGLSDGCAESATTGGVMAAYGLTQGRSPSVFTDWEHQPGPPPEPFHYRLGGAGR